MFSPFFSFPVSYEMTILLASFGSLLGMLFLNRLPRLHPPLLKNRRFCAGATHDKFIVVIETADPKFNDQETRKLLATAGGKQALYNTALTLFDAGDEVITHAPGWPTLVEQIKLADATPVIVRTTADTGFALIMASARRVGELADFVRRGDGQASSGRQHGGSDGQLELYGLHDERVFDWTSDKLKTLDIGEGEVMPTLEELLHLVKGTRMLINIELKGPLTDEIKSLYDYDLAC